MYLTGRVPVDGQAVQFDEFEHGALDRVGQKLGRPVLVARLRRQRLDADAAREHRALAGDVVLVPDVDVVDFELQQKKKYVTTLPPKTILKST